MLWAGEGSIVDIALAAAGVAIHPQPGTSNPQEAPCDCAAEVAVPKAFSGLSPDSPVLISYY
jgi:hypothetical protein